MMNIDKSKLVLVHDNDQMIFDQPLKTKEIGYYKDSWNRFKKNRASLSAFVIILIMLFFVVFGPYMKVYTLAQSDPNEAQRIQYLPPRIPLLEKLGIFDGHRTITRGKQFLVYMAKSEFGEGVIISGMPEVLLDNDPSNDGEYATVTSLKVTVDYYKYTNYVKSYMPEDYYSIQGTEVEKLAKVTRNFTKEQFDNAVKRNVIIDLVAIETSFNPQTGAQESTYIVRLDQFRYAMNQNPEDTYFWFGTNIRGEDLFTKIWEGARISLSMAVVILAINTTVGLLIGSIVGYYGGVLDLLFDRLVEVISSIPFLSVLTLLTLRYGNALWVIVLAFTATGWLGSYGLGRLQFYRFKNREYVLAARTLGASDARIMFKHIFPNTLGLIITAVALSIPSFVFSEASFSFLGIIKYANGVTSVGMLIEEGQAMMGQFPHLLIFPSLYIATLMIAFNLFGNGLRDAFNPSLRGVE